MNKKSIIMAFLLMWLPSNYLSVILALSTIIPTPIQTEWRQEEFHFSSHTVFSVENVEQKVMVSDFAALFTRAAGFTPQIKIGAEEADVHFITDATIRSEAYSLNVSSDQIKIKAADVKGFFYAIQTLRLLLPATIESKTQTSIEWKVPAVVINDEPRFGYRGMMLDVARCFLPKEDVMQIIDCMAMLKLNKLHLHLTDDTGWRIEIKKYPRLTDVGAWQVDRRDLPFYERRNAQPGEQATVGGFYTQEEMKEIIAYAAAKQVDIIPEIDVPAHSNAALAAYPDLACPVVKTPITVLPGLGGKNTEIIYCAGNENTFSFLKEVIDEIVDIFPDKYIHMGGDEAAKSYWKQCPLCQKRMQEEGLKDEEALQGYFMGRMNTYIRAKGKSMMGWDELTNSTVPEEAVIFGWRGFGNAALKAAAEGHSFIMTPARIMYLIRYQGPQWFEPLTYFGNITLKDVYDYEPVQEDWKPEYESLLTGVQASMWTEFCQNTNEVTYQIFPRLAALAETAWGAKGTKNWSKFLKGLDTYLAHLDAKGVVYAKSMYNIQHKVVTQDGRLLVSLNCIRPDVEVRYTMDGSEPNISSALYQETLVVKGALTVKCATFIGNKQMGETLRLPLLYNKATGKPIYGNNSNEVLLTNGVRGSLRQSDFEWCAWDRQDEVSFIIDLLKNSRVHKVLVGCLTNYGMAVHKPKSLVIEISSDNKSFVEVGRRIFTADEIFKEGNFIEDIAFTVQGRDARYVRITAIGAGVCPPEHFMRPGQLARYHIDEVIIE